MASSVLAQLELEVAHRDESLPWGGRSPRGLTKARKGLFLRQEPPKSVSEFADPDQIEMFAQRQIRPLYEGPAPLLPLPWERS